MMQKCAKFACADTLSFSLKISTDLAHLTPNGKAFQRLQSLGAAQVILI